MLFINLIHLSFNRDIKTIRTDRHIDIICTFTKNSKYILRDYNINGCRIYVDIIMFAPNMELFYWSFRSSSAVGGEGMG